MNTFRKGHKYGVRSSAEQRTYRGRVWASVAERDYAERLDLLMQDGQVLWWIEQPLFRLGVPENKYTADFLVQWADAFYGLQAIDVKGVETAAFKRNMKLWAQYGPLPLAIVKRVKGCFVVADVIERGETPGVVSMGASG